MLRKKSTEPDKEQVLAYFPRAQEQSDGKHKILVFDLGMQKMMKQAMACDYEGDALLLAKAAKIVRRDVVLHNSFKFDGKFESGCQKESVPSTLKTLVSMLLNGANLKDQDSIDSQASLTISQSILFNFKKCASSSSKSRHSLDREPPLPLYIGMMIHTETRSKKTVTELHDMGLSVSYDRILQLEDKLATAVCEDFRDKGVVVPAQLRCGVFTAGARITILQVQRLRAHFMARASVCFSFPLHPIWGRNRMTSHYLQLTPRRITSCQTASLLCQLWY